MTDRRPHWDDELLLSVGNAIWGASPTEEVYVSAEMVRSAIAAVEDWQGRTGNAPGGVRLIQGIDSRDEAIQRVRKTCAELPGPPLGPLTEYGKGFQYGYEDALGAVLCALDGDDDE